MVYRRRRKFKVAHYPFLHLGARDIPKVFGTIREQIDNMYVVGYVPQEHGRQGQRRTIELKAIQDKKVKLRAPNAYYVSSP
jgi:hypothetical protein